MFRKTKVDPGQITPEEKELLRRLMETPGVEKEWDFFSDMSRNTPPPEFFMRGSPEPWWLGIAKLLLFIVAVVSIVCMLVRNWGEWVDLLLFIMSVVAVGGVGFLMFGKYENERN